MPDPYVSSWLDWYNQQTDPTVRDTGKRRFAELVNQSYEPFLAFNMLRDASNALGEDLTVLLDREPNIPPLPREEASRLLTQAEQGASWIRRGVAKMFSGAEWWHENVAKTGAALVMTGQGFVGLNPQAKANFEQARQDAMLRANEEGRSLSISDTIEAAREAYFNTDTMRGLKGFMELVFDPLNLVGLGIPGKVGHAIPALKPVLFPLRVIDQAPVVAVNKALEIPARGIKLSPNIVKVLGLPEDLIGKGIPGLTDVPGVKQLLQPHHSTKVRELASRVEAEFASAFGHERYLYGTPADTLDMFSDLTRFPQDTGQFSLRRVVDHLGELVGDDAQFMKMMDGIKQLTPKQATEAITSILVNAETKAFRVGGKLLSGEEVLGFAAQRRKTVSGLMERLALEKKQADAVARVVDGAVGWLDRVYVNKIEPNLIRPWSVAYLAHAGYLPMNMVEDVAMSTLGMGNFHRLAMSDVEFQLKTVGLPKPVHLNNAEKLALDSVSAYQGTYSEIARKKGVLEHIADPFKIVDRTSKMGWSIRRATWVETFDKNFTRALRDAGVSTTELNTMRDIVQTEFPAGMEHLRQEITSKVWMAMQTGDATHIRALKDIVSQTRAVQRAQASLLSELPELPPDVRAAFLQGVWKDGGITPDNVTRIADAMQDKLIDWHRWTGETIKSEMTEALRAIGEAPVGSPAEALGVLRRLQHMADTINQLPRETNAHYRELGVRKSPQMRGELFEEGHRFISEDIAEVRRTYTEMLEKTKPQIQKWMSEVAKTPTGKATVARSVDDIFDSYSRIGTNLQDTWDAHRKFATDYFASTAPEERGFGFWEEFRRRTDEIWSAERDFRFEQANRAREGWSSLFDQTPPARTKKDVDFQKAAAHAAYQDADAKLNTLRIDIADLERTLNELPDSLRAARMERIERLKKQAVVAADHRKRFESRLKRLGNVRSDAPVGLPELRDHDKAIRSFEAAVRAARKHAPDQVAQWEDMLRQSRAAREQVFEKNIPTWMRADWERLNTRISELQAGAPASVERMVKAQSPTLPRELTGAKPRFNVGEVSYQPAFQSDVDKALYIVSQPTPSKADAKYMTWLRSAVPGVDDAALRQMGQAVRQQIRQFTAQQPDGGVLRIPDMGNWQPKKPFDAQGAARSELNELVRERNAMRREIESGNALLRSGDTAADDAAQRIADAVLQQTGGEVPPTVDEMLTIINGLDTPSAKGLKDVLGAGGEAAQEVLESVYAKVVSHAPPADLTPLQLETLRRVESHAIFPTKALNELVDAGFVGQPQRQLDGRWRVEVTEKGQRALEGQFGESGQQVFRRLTEQATGGVDTPLTPQAADAIVESTTANGGASFTLDGRNVVDEVNAGRMGRYFVGAYPDREVTIGASELSSARVKQFADANQEVLSKPNHFVGTWHDEASGQVFLDVSISVADEKDAMRLAAFKNQKAIFDAQTFNELPTVAPESGRLNIDDIMRDLPQPVREFETTIEHHMESVRTMLDKAVEIQRNPPMSTNDATKLGRYFDRVASEVGQRPEMTAGIKKARRAAADQTNKMYDDWFVNYDNRSTMDFMMQRLFPFWMYASRRWPRLMRIAAKRPVMSKYIAMIGGDWDYGHVPTPFGFEFHPAKGTLAGATRRLFMRDFPEMYDHKDDWRANVEQGMDDWFGRFGFYFNPGITSAFSLLQGEPANIAPPTISLVLHGLGALGAKLPQPLEDFAYSSRYVDFLTDRVIADKFALNPQEVRRNAALDPEMAGLMAVARQEASVRLIALNQASVLRYNPQSRRDYVADVKQLVEEIVGIPAEEQDNLRRLGISVYEIVAVSGPQRKALRETIPNYEAWAGSTMALKTLEEQRVLRAMDSFWADFERERERHAVMVADLDRRWQSGLISGNQARDEYAKVMASRAGVFEALRSRPEYREVPFTIEERLAHAERFGRPAPLIHPIDEALENYYAISPESHVDQATGEVKWADYFAEREGFLKAIDQTDRRLYNMVMDALSKSDTQLERAFRLASPKIREYYGVRDAIHGMLSPEGQAAYQEYRRLRNLASLSTNEQQRAAYEREALLVSVNAPDVRQAEIMVRFARQQMRMSDPEMEAVYQMFIAQPGSFPTATGSSRSRIIQMPSGVMSPMRPTRP